ncbi:MAG: GNAT family N-acetyltransferase [Chitinophagales bacterium]
MYQILQLLDLNELQWKTYFQFHMELAEKVKTPFELPNDFKIFMKIKSHSLGKGDAKESIVLQDGKMVAWLQYKVYGFGETSEYGEIYFDTFYEPIPKGLLKELKSIVTKNMDFFNHKKSYIFEAHNPRFKELVEFCGAEIMGTNCYFELERNQVNTELTNTLLKSDLLENEQLQFVFHDSLPEYLYESYTHLFNEGFSSIPHTSPIPIQLTSMEGTAQMVKNFEKGGSHIYSAWLLDKNRKGVAYTIIYLEDKTVKTIGKQWLTVVTKPYQGKGLAKYLKAAMLQEVFASVPEMQAVHTNCTSINYPMMAVNQQLGFEKVGEKYEYALTV